AARGALPAAGDGRRRPRRGATRRGPRRRARAAGGQPRVSAARGAPWRGRRLHFVGVGGAGLSGYARAASELGARVSGSDSASSPYLERLAADGVLRAVVGHRAGNVPRGQGVELIY